jgi:GTPase Era involved in 16S rRNA processing
MIRRDQITSSFDNSKIKHDFDDWCSLSVTSSVRDGDFSALTFDEKRLFHVGVELFAETYISPNDNSQQYKIEDILRRKIMNYLYGEILNSVHDIRINIEFEGRDKAIDAVDNLLKKLSVEINGE